MYLELIHLLANVFWLMQLRIRYLLLNYLFINVVQESDFEFESSQWQPLKYFKWKLGLCLLPEWISMKWVASVKCCEGYGGILICMGTNENSSCVQTLKLHFFCPLLHFILCCSQPVEYHVFINCVRYP